MSDLTRRESSDQTNVALTANSPAAVPQLQAGLLEWAKRKLELVKREANDATETVAAAVQAGFTPNSLRRLEAAAKRRVVYYTKIVAALEAGYCLFPTVDAALFAVRTNRTSPDASWHDYQSGVPDVQAQLLMIGEGSYVSPIPLVSSDVFEEGEGTAVVKRKKWQASDIAEVEFPLRMAKPEIINVVSEAMALKLFDEIGIIPAQRHGDPIIVGMIIDPRGAARMRRRVSFLLSWYVDTREL